MAAWGSSPYRGIGVYLGGDEAACAQPNLNSSWVAQVAAAGWHLIPIYVGAQAACADAAFSNVIQPSDATAEGQQSAQSAVALASAVGLGPGNPVYYDMESWTNTDVACNAAVLDYLDGWTTELHALGYSSGVYSSASTGITAMVDVVGTGFAEPDELWFGDWNGQATTSDPYVPSEEWMSDQRVHQYSGGHDETYGGATLNIDGDYANALFADSGSGSPPGTIPTVGNTAGDVALSSGEELRPGTSIVTANGQYRLDMQASDGNLVLYTAGGQPLWSTATDHSPGDRAVMQGSDGNFVVYSAANAPLWDSHTGHNQGASLALQADGNAFIYGSADEPLWSTNTMNTRMSSGDRLNGGWSLESTNRSYKLVEQKSDGNLVLYNYAGKPLWSSRTAGNVGAFTVLQSDGNVVEDSASRRVLFTTGSSSPGDRLLLQHDGNLVLYAASGAVLWASGTS